MHPVPVPHECTRLRSERAQAASRCQCYHSDSTRMARSRLSEAIARVRRSPAPSAAVSRTTDRSVSARELLLYSWAGRLFIGAAALKVVLGIVRQFAALPPIILLLNGAATVALAVS